MGISEKPKISSFKANLDVDVRALFGLPPEKAVSRPKPQPTIAERAAQKVQEAAASGERRSLIDALQVYNKAVGAHQAQALADLESPFVSTPEILRRLPIIQTSIQRDILTNARDQAREMAEQASKLWGTSQKNDRELRDHFEAVAGKLSDAIAQFDSGNPDAAFTTRQRALWDNDAYMAWLGRNLRHSEQLKKGTMIGITAAAGLTAVALTDGAALAVLGKDGVTALSAGAQLGLFSANVAAFNAAERVLENRILDMPLLRKVGFAANMIDIGQDLYKTAAIMGGIKVAAELAPALLPIAKHEPALIATRNFTFEYGGINTSGVATGMDPRMLADAHYHADQLAFLLGLKSANGVITPIPAAIKSLKSRYESFVESPVTARLVLLPLAALGMFAIPSGPGRKLGGPTKTGTDLTRPGSTPAGPGTALGRVGAALVTGFNRWTGGVFAGKVELTPEQVEFLKKAVFMHSSTTPASISRRDLNALNYALQHDVGSITKKPELLASAITFLDTPTIYKDSLGSVLITNNHRGDPMANQTLAAMRLAQSRLLGTGQMPPPNQPELVDVSVDKQCKNILGRWYVLLTYDQYRRLEDGVKLSSLFGEKVVIGRDRIDMETRNKGGLELLAYGIPLEDLRVPPVPGSVMHVAITNGVARPASALSEPHKSLPQSETATNYLDDVRRILVPANRPMTRDIAEENYRSMQQEKAYDQYHPLRDSTPHRLIAAFFNVSIARSEFLLPYLAHLVGSSISTLPGTLHHPELLGAINKLQRQYPSVPLSQVAGQKDLGAQRVKDMLHAAIDELPATFKPMLSQVTIKARPLVDAPVGNNSFGAHNNKLFIPPVFADSMPPNWTPLIYLFPEVINPSFTTPVAKALAVRFILMHEFGHYLGLDHVHLKELGLF